MNQGPPYRPTVWGLGGTPEIKVDIPITVVFLVLYMLGAITHFVLFHRNNRRGHKFIFSAMLFGFCMSRIVTTILRIASVSLPTNLRLAIVAQIFVAAGVVIIFIINIFWAQRIVRALHPSIGWHPTSTVLVKVLIALIIVTLAIVITATVQSFYTLRPRTGTIDRDFQIYGTFFLAIISFLPIPIIFLSFICGSHPSYHNEALEDGFTVTLALPRRTSSLDRFGKGRMRTKALILLAGSTLLSLGATFRCGTLWLPPVPRSQPLPPYFSKACFYIINFVIEVLVIYLYAFMRVDLRFHVPDGSHGTYDVPQQPPTDTRGDVETGAAGDYEKTGNPIDAAGSSSLSVSNSTRDLTALPPASPTSTHAMMPTMNTARPTTVTKIPKKKATRTSVLDGLKRLKELKKPAPTRAQKREWRKSEQERIIRRLGGPGEQIGG